MRKVIYIDVSKMSEKELCATLKIPYVPWYKSSLFWGMVLVFAAPSLLTLLSLIA